MHENFKSGFVSIIGKPNAGKSTLMNRLVGEKLSIITPKAQTTRHRVMGILTDENYQIVYSDTPGILLPDYKLQESMMKYVKASLEDADLVLLVAELGEKYDPDIIERIRSAEIPMFFILNKCDLSTGSQASDKMEYWKTQLDALEYFQVSALTGEGMDMLTNSILSHLPVHPPYFPQDDISDKPQKFFASEIVREKIFLLYRKEVPYACEVEISEFIQEPDLLRIRAEIYVERQSQKGILIGKKGEAIREMGIAARKDMEEFFGIHVYLETFVKVSENWRKTEKGLRRFGYF